MSGETFAKPIEARPAGTVASFESFTAIPVTPVLGAEIDGIELGGALSDQQVRDVHNALLELPGAVFPVIRI